MDFPDWRQDVLYGEHVRVTWNGRFYNLVHELSGSYLLISFLESIDWSLLPSLTFSVFYWFNFRQRRSFEINVWILLSFKYFSLSDEAGRNCELSNCML
jgi:hypothetical protein